jgi:sugar/nucleoside kinase (ribokinase family)
MDQVLVLGSTCVDVLLKIDHVPQSGQDANITSQQLRTGGCAFNVYDMIRHFGIPCRLCSPVGSGIYGAYIEQEFHKRGIPVFARINDRENGCCYCIIDDSGERTFLSHHGAEYLFNPAWFNCVRDTDFDSIFVCGLELEEQTSPELISFIEFKKSIFEKSGKHLPVYFAPGPRITAIQTDFIARLFALGAVVHLNEDEALRFTKEDSVQAAAKKILSATNNHVIITLGSNGAYCYNAITQTGSSIPPFCTTVKDTIGAGDGHFGAVIAGLKSGEPLENAVRRANKIASRIVATSGSTLTDAEFRKIDLTV